MNQFHRMILHGIFRLQSWRGFMRSGKQSIRLSYIFSLSSLWFSSSEEGYWRVMSLLVTDLGYVWSYRRQQAMTCSERGCTVSHRRGPGVSTQPYRINTPATGTMRSNERTVAALVCEQQAKCSLSGSHLSAGIEVLALESIPSLVTSW